MNAIGEYFRTAVLIDDRADDDDSPLEPLQQFASLQSEPTEGMVPPTDADETPLYWSRLVRAFLREGIVCSVLKPEPQAEDLTKLTLLAAETADLLILDWLLFGDRTETVSLINAVAEEQQDRLRVVVIYTGISDLLSVKQSLIDECDFTPTSDYLLRRDNTVAIIFGKPGVELPTDEKDRTTDYEALPGRIREELTSTFGGVVPEFVFASINSLRSLAPRWLATFNRNLDSGYLLHRMLLPNPEDAREHLADLLADEFLAAMAERGTADKLSDTTLARHLVGPPTLIASPDELAALLKRSSKLSDPHKNLPDIELVRLAVRRGIAPLGLGDSWSNKALNACVSAFGGGDTQHERFAALMCSRPLGDSPPALELGIVLTHNEAIYLCIQPLCDSVRIEGSRQFLMVPLKEVARGAETSVLIEFESGMKRLRFTTRPYLMRMPSFEATDGGRVVAIRTADTWTFTDRDGGDYTAICRLREAFARQALATLSGAVARPGANASEWLRRLGGSG